MTSPSEAPVFSNLSGDPEMRELVEEFVGHLCERIRAVEAAIQANDLSEVVRLAHQLKGASGGYGFEEIGEAAAGLERSAKAAREVSHIAGDAAELIALCRRATSEPES